MSRTLLFIALIACSYAGAGELTLPFSNYEEAMIGATASPGSTTYIMDDIITVEIANDSADEFWTFTKSNHPAHPSAIKRIIGKRNGQMFVDMGIICEADEAACKNLVARYQKISQRISTPFERPMNIEPSSDSGTVWVEAPNFWLDQSGDTTNFVAGLAYGITVSITRMAEHAGTQAHCLPPERGSDFTVLMELLNRRLQGPQTAESIAETAIDALAEEFPC